MNLSNIIDRAAACFADKPALIFGKRVYSYGELQDSVNRIASHLVNEGLKPGDRVALYAPNSPQWVASYYGIIRAGGVVVCLNPVYKGFEIEHLLADCNPRLIIISEELADNLPKQESSTDLQAVMSFQDDPVLSTAFDVNNLSGHPSVPVPGEADDVCVILYTGGTTGPPKGAMLTHRNILFTAQNVCYHERTQPDDRALCFMPLNHVFGGNHIMNSMFYGCGTLVLHESFDLDRILESLETDRVTRFYSVPTVYIRLMAGKGYKRNFSSVTYCFSAATSMASEIVRQWIDTYGLTIHEAYGMTETSSLVTYNHMYQHRIGSVGTPAGIVEIRIVDPDGNEVSPGDSGEISVRGPNVMKGYLNRPDETAATIRDGWLHSGDVGRLDAEGYLYIVDRIKDVIITGGYNVFPCEVEEVLYTFPGVAECAVVGLEHREYGEAVTAYMIFKEGFHPSEKELTEFCKSRLASYKVPKEFRTIGEFPKSNAGKILKRKIREMDDSLSNLE
jgi:long-chain acyl-CoA synthetase